jgi:hypothetical protein
MTGRRLAPRRLALVLALLGMGASTPCPAPISHGSAKLSSQLESVGLANTNFPEVRIRKLHLVRPDLIPYPLVHDVYC